MDEFNEMFLTVLRFWYNLGFEDFAERFTKAIGGNFVDTNYCQEKFDSLRNNFIYFYCNLDRDTQNNMIKIAIVEKIRRQEQKKQEQKKLQKQEQKRLQKQR